MSDSPDHLAYLDEKQDAALRRDRALRWVVVLIATVAMAMSGAGLIIVAHRSGKNENRIENTEPKVAAAAKKATVVEKRVARNVTQTKRIVRYLAGKQGLPGVPGKNGKLGAPGPPGKPGKAGKPATKSDIAAAVAAYCAGDVCKPPGVSRDDVLAAVTVYCSTHTCRGPAGETGATGAAGKAGAAGRDADPPPGGFSAAFPDFAINCLDAGIADSAGHRTYTCTSTPTTAPATP